MKTVILGLIVMFLYAIIGFLEFTDGFTEGEDKEYQLYCNPLYLCWSSAINAIRIGGGLGEQMEQPF